MSEQEMKRPDAASENSQSEPAAVTVVGVCFRGSTKTYYFNPRDLVITVKDHVIVETARGLEFGKVTMPNRAVSSSQIVSPLKNVVRIATPADIKRNEDNRAAEERARAIGEEKIAKHKLEMKLVDVEYTFDNQKLLFYFTADGRVDFRELVKDLASVFRTRIELRQIGIRDEAKMMGGLGICGRPFCCSSFLPDFVQVSIKMAKEQNFSLNSAKISGSCGRLMCCLRYEHEVYEEALKTTPPVGSTVSTANGEGVVTEARPLAQVVKVRLFDSNDAPKLYPCADITLLAVGKGRRPKNENREETEDKSEDKSESERRARPNSDKKTSGNKN